MNSGGINTVLRNKYIGPLPSQNTTPRGRFDSLGRTVYFATSAKGAFAEVLQVFKLKRVALAADAQAIGLSVDKYITLMKADLKAVGQEPPWIVGADWQMLRSLYEVRMPRLGYWVAVEHHETLSQLSLDLADKMRDQGLSDVTLSTVTGGDRGVTTLIAQHIRDSILDDGSLPIGIVFPSKLGYGDNLAWWNRRLDDGLNPGADDPSVLNDLNVCVPAFDLVLREFGLSDR